MDNQYVAQAQAAYQARDFQAASQAYVQLLQDPSVPKGPGDLGYLYHQLGNCLQLGQSVRFQARLRKRRVILKSPPPMPNTTLLRRPIWAWAMRF